MTFSEFAEEPLRFFGNLIGSTILAGQDFVEVLTFRVSWLDTHWLNVVFVCGLYFYTAYILHTTIETCVKVLREEDHPQEDREAIIFGSFVHFAMMIGASVYVIVPFLVVMGFLAS